VDGTIASADILDGTITSGDILDDTISITTDLDLTTDGAGSGLDADTIDGNNYNSTWGKHGP